MKGENARSTGMTQSDTFLDSPLPSLYDMFNETYGEPFKPKDQERAIARALEVGVNYFDTAVQYGDGESEKNLGCALQKLKPANAIVGTKVRLQSADFGRIGDAVAKSVDGSLNRLCLERVDILHLHNAITVMGGGEALSVRQVLDEVAPAFESLR